jgi:hypothetical protein
MLLHPFCTALAGMLPVQFGRPWGFPMLDTASQTLIGCMRRVPAGGAVDILLRE